MNSIILKGRLTDDPQLSTVGRATLGRFTVAVKRDFKNKDGEYDTDFINCTVWDKKAEFVDQYFRKGQEILIQGSLRINKYQDRDYPEVTHYASEIYVSSVEFCGSSDSGNNDRGDRDGDRRSQRDGRPQRERRSQRDDRPQRERRSQRDDRRYRDDDYPPPPPEPADWEEI